jgi:hypothetical protein
LQRSKERRLPHLAVTDQHQLAPAGDDGGLALERREVTGDRRHATRDEREWRRAQRVVEEEDVEGAGELADGGREALNSIL